MATSIIGALASLGQDAGEAQVKNRVMDLNEQNVQSEITSRKNAADVALGQLNLQKQTQERLAWAGAITYPDPERPGKFKQYNPTTMQIRQMPDGFDPTYDPAKDPTAAIKRAELANGGPLPDAVKQRIIAHVTGSVNLPTTSALKQEPDQASPTGFSWVRRDVEGNEVARSVATPPAGFVPTVSNSTQTDPMGLQTTTHTVKTKTVPGSTPLASAAPGAPGAPASPATGQNSALAAVVGKTGKSAPVSASAAAAPSAVAATPATNPANVVTIPNQAADNTSGQSSIDTSKLSAQERKFLPMAQQWAERGIKPPQKYEPFVTDVMNKIGVVPFTEETAAYKNARSAIRDVLPILESLKQRLEPIKDQNNYFFGPNSSFSQRSKWLSYTIGGKKPDNPLDADVMQLASFSQIAAAAPWAKVGRGKYIYDKVQLHLPDASKDNAANMYDKTNRLIDIFKDELQRSPSKTGTGSWAAYPGTDESGKPTSALGNVVQSQTPQAKAKSILDEADARAKKGSK